MPRATYELARSTKPEDERPTKENERTILKHAIDPLRLVITSIFGGNFHYIVPTHSPLRLESLVSGDKFHYILRPS